MVNVGLGPIKTDADIDLDLVADLLDGYSHGQMYLRASENEK